MARKTVRTRQRVVTSTTFSANKRFFVSCGFWPFSGEPHPYQKTDGSIDLEQAANDYLEHREECRAAYKRKHRKPDVEPFGEFLSGKNTTARDYAGRPWSERQ